MGKNKPLVNVKDSRGILLGRKMRSERNQRLKVIGQVTVTRQEFFSFCCANVSMVKNNLIKIRMLATMVSIEQYRESTTVDLSQQKQRTPASMKWKN